MTGPDLTHARWRKSSHSGSQAAECVEAAGIHRGVAVRDSKDPDGPVISMDGRAWRSLLDALRDGR
ncbi:MULTISPECIES: DUF397 domain-containing protein [Actinomadura]|uniref:DUF397 domain-containing protein n=1 Tax=Actinomadura yumaensis TaxID=111807 RepID=A0ABW2CY33_9ACTN|nr:DUF397 domain-containing protein [Actinomadura sp. J1-007]MWK37995.1 DUF397 domain-containing protein [Actinomadura sp. J1-007]